MSSRKISDLHPLMQPVAREFLKQADKILGPDQAFITDGFRSNAEQTRLYAQGRTAPGRIVTQARAGQSPHNYGLAIDIAFRKDNTNEAKWTIKNYEKLAGLAKSIGLVWGGTWTGFTDRPHFELRGWRDIKSNKLVKKESKPMAKAKKKESPLQACLRQHTDLVTELDTVKRQKNSYFGKYGTEKTAKEVVEEKLRRANETIVDLKAGKPVEAIKDPARYLASLAIGALLTYVYGQFPFLGELAPDKQAIAVTAIGLTVKAWDKLSHELGWKTKLPF